MIAELIAKWRAEADRLWASELHVPYEVTEYARALSGCADDLQTATTWTPVAESLPDEGRRCWVWIEDAYGTGRKLLATRQVAVRGSTWWHDARGEALDRWRVVCWQYEVVPADPCREVTP